MIQIQSHFDAIADGLAETGFAVIDDFLAKDDIKAIADSGLFVKHNLKKSGMGKENKLINESVRGDFTLWVDKEMHPSIERYLKIADELRLYLNRSLFLSLKDFEAHLALYPAGTFYKRHLDQFKSDDHRKISVILYLNSDWKEENGGQLRMYLKDGGRDFYPLGGRMVCFRSDMIEHEVLPATRERLSITGWMLDQISDLRHL